MRSNMIVEAGLEICQKLVEVGFRPCITGSSWLKIKLPDEEVLLDDFDIFCPDFDPERSPIKDLEVRASNGGVRYLFGPQKKIEIIKTLKRGIRMKRKDFEVWRGIRHMASNNFWMATALNKIANALSIRMHETAYWRRYKVVVPLANCILAHWRGLKVDPKGVAWLLSNDKFTNSRIAHLYNTDLIYIAAVITSRYYLHGGAHPDALAMRFCDEVIRPIAEKMGVY